MSRPIDRDQLAMAEPNPFAMAEPNPLAMAPDSVAPDIEGLQMDFPASLVKPLDDLTVELAFYLFEKFIKIKGEAYRIPVLPGIQHSIIQLSKVSESWERFIAGEMEQRDVPGYSLHSTEIMTQYGEAFLKSDPVIKVHWDAFPMFFVQAYPMGSTYGSGIEVFKIRCALQQLFAMPRPQDQMFEPCVFT